MVRKTAVEKSEHRDEIDDFLLKGESARFVSKYIYDKYNEKISHQAITRYRKKCLNVEDQVRIEYQDKKSKEKLHGEVSKGVTDLEELDKIIYEDCNLKSKLEDVEDPLERENLKIKLKNSKSRAVQIKHQILKDDDTHVEVTYNGLTGLADAIRKSKEENSREQENI